MTIQKVFEFVVLYIWAVIKWFLAKPEPLGIKGELVTLFYDTIDGKPHGVCVFLIPNNLTPDAFSQDLWGPFGYSSSITLFGKHLYGRDTWGSPSDAHLQINPQLGQLAKDHPDRWLVLAGVRKIGRRHPWPLDEPTRYILPWKLTR